ncbi:MAG: tetratricopeptide repeat protein [Planctomycetota bacterium]|nr:tetratricopeptide repeat protein [Planctomycetota bacterium]
MRVLGVVAVLVGIAAADGRETFEKAFGEIRTQARKQKWGKARALLEALLKEHAEQDYVRVRRTSIVDLMKQCVFRSTNPLPDPKDLVAGDLLEHNLMSGRLRLRYEGGNLKDFRKIRDLYIHPAAFSGPHILTIKGTYPKSGSGPTVAVCVTSDEHYMVAFGNAGRESGAHVRVRYYKGGGSRTVADRYQAKINPGRRFTIKISVKNTNLNVLYNGKTLMRAKKGADQWGSIAVFAHRAIKEIHIEGRAEPSWLQGLIDKASQKQLEKFEKSYRDEDFLPGWLLRDARATKRLKKPDERTWPGALGSTAKSVIARSTLHHTAGEYLEGYRYVRDVPRDGIPQSLRFYLMAKFHEDMGLFEQAVKEYREVAKLDPEFVSASVAAALLLAKLQKTGEAVRLFETLIERYPGGADLRAGCAIVLMKRGRMDEARAILENAAAQRVTSRALRRVHDMLVKAVDGPPWARRFEHKSLHYHVISDIDRATCAKATSILETAYLSYIARLDRVASTRRKRFRVYLFSGRGGYDAYCKDLLGHTAPHSAGLYSPVLKQLLIWNLPKREAMMRTVRHEGFHQYLDRIMDDPPLWFNEGLAEYYETAEVKDGRWNLGAKRADHLRTLRLGTQPLKVFLLLNSRAFMAGARRNYAQAWAFIQFLRHGTSANRKLFERFWEAFKTIPESRKAIRHALDGRDLVALDREFRKHLAGLAAGR